MRALVAMSGGVDSSVAAALMVEAGHEVVGVTLKQWQGADGSMPVSGCCTAADAADARSVADRLGIAYYVLDHVEEFTRMVVEPFGAEYLAGRTPNPCVECNRRVRFGALLARVESLGCDFLVTGHHARIEGPSGARRLVRGRDARKDQSYVLHMLTGEQLDRIELPIGEITKEEVRAHAARLGLRTAAKPDSQDLCFVGGDYRDLLRARFPASAEPGEIVDLDGSVVGGHGGTSDFTIGQRKGLGIAATEPRYVVDIDPARRQVVVGPRSALMADGCKLSDVTWIDGSSPTGPVSVQIRYRSPAVPAQLGHDGDRVLVWFDEPQEAVTPGQAGVIYDGDRVMGGGTIAAALRQEVPV